MESNDNDILDDFNKKVSRYAKLSFKAFLFSSFSVIVIFTCAYIHFQQHVAEDPVILIAAIFGLVFLFSAFLGFYFTIKSHRSNEKKTTIQVVAFIGFSIFFIISLFYMYILLFDLELSY